MTGFNKANDNQVFTSRTDVGGEKTEEDRGQREREREMTETGSKVRSLTTNPGRQKQV